MTPTKEQVEQVRAQLRGIVSDWSPNDDSADYHCAKVDALCTLALQAIDMREALTPSADTKAAYMGEFSFDEIVTYQDGNDEEVDFTVKRYVPWTTIKEIMAAIKARALPTGGE